MTNPDTDPGLDAGKRTTNLMNCQLKNIYKSKVIRNKKEMIRLIEKKNFKFLDQIKTFKKTKNIDERYKKDFIRAMTKQKLSAEIINELKNNE